jgi:nitroreductase
MKTLLRTCYHGIGCLVDAVARRRPLWGLYVMRTRLRFPLSALYHGVRLNRNGGGLVFNFRRNIQRLEKGLIHQPPKEVFAQDYIVETVRGYVQGKGHGLLDSETLSWGEAVLARYFSVCEHIAVVADAYEQFCQESPTCGQPERTPYAERLRTPLSVSYDELHRLACRRRSIRFFTDEPVDPELVARAIELSVLSPNACNRQSYRFVLINDETLANQVLGCTFGFRGYTAPAVVVVIGRYRGYFDERDIFVPAIDAGLATMSLLYALETLGFGSSCVNWPNVPRHEKAIREHVSMEQDELIMLLIAVGHPAPEGMVAFSSRRSLDSVFEVVGEPASQTEGSFEKVEPPQEYVGTLTRSEGQG